MTEGGGRGSFPVPTRDSCLLPPSPSPPKFLGGARDLYLMDRDVPRRTFDVVGGGIELYAPDKVAAARAGYDAYRCGMRCEGLDGKRLLPFDLLSERERLAWVECAEGFYRRWMFDNRGSGSW